MARKRFAIYSEYEASGKRLGSLASIVAVPENIYKTLPLQIYGKLKTKNKFTS